MKKNYYYYFGEQFARIFFSSYSSFCLLIKTQALTATHSTLNFFFPLNSMYTVCAQCVHTRVTKYYVTIFSPSLLVVLASSVFCGVVVVVVKF